MDESKSDKSIGPGWPEKLTRRTPQLPGPGVPGSAPDNAIRTGQRPLGIFIGTTGVIISLIPICTPFRHISGHIKKSVAIRRKTPYRGGKQKTIFVIRIGIVVGHKMPALLRGLIPPGKRLSYKPPPGGCLPFGFSRQPISFSGKRAQQKPRPPSR
jgi:hypothetical protein